MQMSSLCKAVRPATDLTYTTPESLGIPSSAVVEFLDEIADKLLNLHGFLLLRHGKVVAEGYWPPFDENRKHRMYSISKSFTSVAVGMMIDEGKMSLDSKAAEFFPEYLPDDPHPYVLEATVRDLLLMATYNKENAYSYDTLNFVETFFKDSRPKHKPGQIFSYDTAGTDTLCAIVEKLSGKSMLEYMRPVLDEIGFSKDAYCIKTPEGGSWAGSGVMCTSRDLARFALLCMNGGQWNGKQLLNRDYIAEATSCLIDNMIGRAGNEAQYGYGYQFWRLRKGGFAMYGMGSQYALCLPHHGTILITNADTQGCGSAGDLIMDAYYRLVDKMKAGPLAEDINGHSRLIEQISRLTMPLPKGQPAANARGLSNKTFGKYTLDENEAGMEWLKFYIEADKYRLQYKNATGEHELLFGIGEYIPQLFPEKYWGRQAGICNTHYQCIGGGAWVGDNTFIGTIYSVDDHLGSIKFQLTFADDEVSGLMTKAAQWFFDEYQGFLSGRAE